MSGLPAGKDVGEFIELGFKPDSWEARGVPEVGCHIRLSDLVRLLQKQGAYLVDELILGLMDWLDVTDQPAPALQALSRLLDRHYPADGHQSGRCCFRDEHGMDRTFRVGPIELGLPLVTWQRRHWIIAAAQPSTESGRIVVGAPQPTSFRTALRILSVSVLDYMGEPFDSFAGARTSCGKTGAFYSWEVGDVTPIHWDAGLDKDARTSLKRGRSEAQWLPPNQLAVQVAIAGGYKKPSRCPTDFRPGQSL